MTARQVMLREFDDLVNAAAHARRAYALDEPERMAEQWAAVKDAVTGLNQMLVLDAPDPRDEDDRRLEAKGYRLHARFLLSGPYSSVLACLLELENQPMFLEITRFEAQFKRPDAARGDLMTAKVVLSSMVLQEPPPTRP